MDKTWQNFLEQNHANLLKDRVTDFGHPKEELIAAQKELVLTDLSHKGLIKVSGPDAKTFLQGQLTCDLNDIDESLSRLGAHCNPKGRILAAFRLFKIANDYFLFMPKSIIAATLAQLQKYAIFAKAELSDCSDQWIRIGVSGPIAATVIKNILDEVPQNIDQVLQRHEVIAVRINGPMPRYVLFGPSNKMLEVWSTLSETCKCVGADAWQLLNIIVGSPTIYPATIGHFTPHQVNYQLLNGVSFKKGCYTGQEIVARMEHLGKLKSHMVRGIITGKTIPRPGDEIVTMKNNEEIDVGDIVIAKPDGQGSFQLLAVMKDAFVKDDLCYIKNRPDNKIKFLPLPYHIKKPE